MSLCKNLTVSLLSVCCAFLIGCAPNIQNKEAVKQGILDYFTKQSAKMGLNVDSMIIDVVAVSFLRNEARATVAFRAKQSGAVNDAPMQMIYTLEQKGNKWEVKGRPSAATDTHTPAGEPPAGELPPGHPPTAAPKSPQALPPGHPPVDSSKKPETQKN